VLIETLPVLELELELELVADELAEAPAALEVAAWREAASSRVTS
jgi:hypothetical protein